MNRYLLLMAMLMVFKAASAQTENTGPQVANQSFTLDQCISYALENNVSLKNAVLDEEIADGRVKETRGIGLPQIDASVSVLHNQKLPRFFGPNVDTSIHKGAFSF